jgi:hypothetical protein
MTTKINFNSELSSAINNSQLRRYSMIQVGSKSPPPLPKRHSICGPVKSTVTAVHTKFQEIESYLKALPPSTDLTLARISLHILKTRVNGATDKDLIEASKELFFTDLQNVEAMVGSQEKIREIVNQFVEQQQKDLETIANRQIDSVITVI